MIEGWKGVQRVNGPAHACGRSMRRFQHGWVKRREAGEGGGSQVARCGRGVGELCARQGEHLLERPAPHVVQPCTCTEAVWIEG
jgi:hypothetical protein